MDNPYAAPVTDSTTTEKITLYYPGSIAWATFLGAPIAGCILLALNYKRLGESMKANLTWISGLVATIAVLVIAFFLPDNFPNSILPLAYTFGLYQYVKVADGRTYDRVLLKGGKKGSAWMATGIGLLCLIVILMLLFVLLLVAPEEWFVEELQEI